MPGTARRRSQEETRSPERVTEWASMNGIWKSLHQLPESPHGLLFVLCLSFLLRMSLLIFMSDAAINRDGVLYIAAAKQFAGGSFRDGLAIWRTPLYPLLILFVHYFVPQWVTAARLIGVISFVLVLIPLYFLTEDLFSRRAAFWSCLLFTVSPLPLRWTTFVMRDQVFILFLTCAVYFAQRRLSSRRVIHLLAAAAFCWASTFLRPEGAIIFPVYLIVLIGCAITRPDERRSYVRDSVIWLSVPIAVLIAALGMLGPESLHFNRYDEAVRHVQEFFEFKFLGNVRQLRVLLREMERNSPGGEWSQNFAQITRKFMAVIYLLGLLQSFVRVLFVLNLIPLFYGLRRYRLQATHIFTIFFIVTYLLMIYYFAIVRNFIDSRFLFGAAVITYCLVGAGMETILTSLQRFPHARVLGTIVVIGFLFAPVSKYDEVLAKSDNIVMRAGEWLASQPHFEKRKLICTDPRILFYAGREISLRDQGADVLYLDQPQQRLEQIARENGCDAIVIREPRKRIPFLPEIKAYTRVKEFIGDEQVVIIYYAVDGREHAQNRDPRLSDWKPLDA
jgi:4-amino-4-deoxy-L-arabinose transferase-like glycosyltransferase